MRLALGDILVRASHAAIIITMNSKQFSKELKFCSRQMLTTAFVSLQRRCGDVVKRFEHKIGGRFLRRCSTELNELLILNQNTKFYTKAKTCCGAHEKWMNNVCHVMVSVEWASSWMGRETSASLLVARLATTVIQCLSRLRSSSQFSPMKSQVEFFH